jgi:hypothetical protein
VAQRPDDISKLQRAEGRYGGPGDGLIKKEEQVMKIRIYGYTELTGTPEEIVQAMQEARYIPVKGSYIEQIQRDAKQYFDTELNVTGDTEHERAESLLREMANANMIMIEEEN